MPARRRPRPGYSRSFRTYRHPVSGTVSRELRATREFTTDRAVKEFPLGADLAGALLLHIKNPKIKKDPQKEEVGVLEVSRNCPVAIR